MIDEINNLLKEISKNLYQKAEERKNMMTHEIKRVDDIKR